MKFNPAPKALIQVSPRFSGWLDYILKGKNVNELSLPEVSMLQNCLFTEMAEQQSSYGESELYKALEELLYDLEYYYYGL